MMLAYFDQILILALGLAAIAGMLTVTIALRSRPEPAGRSYAV